MSSNTLCVWSSNTSENKESIIIPDGCRDLIFIESESKHKQCYISPLFERAKLLKVEKGTNFNGFRFKAGVFIQEDELLSKIKTNHVEYDDIQNLLEDFTDIDESVGEALDCLSCRETDSVKNASLRLGVSIRTLQRMISRKTERSPNYWFQLARVRRAARGLYTDEPLINIAHKHGFFDQAHMNREVKRWFGLTPSAMRENTEVKQQLNDLGYG